MTGVFPHGSQLPRNQLRGDGSSTTGETSHHFAVNDNLASGISNMKLQLPGKQSDKSPSSNLPSLFDGASPFGYRPKPAARSPGIGQPLKLDTTPEAINEYSLHEYVTTKPLVPSVPQKPNDAVSPLTVGSPLSGGSSASSTSSATGQAAEMQARILALQRSRSKLISSPRSAPLNSPQGSTSRRTSSNFGGSLSGLSGPPSQKSSSRTSVSTLDSCSTESEGDDISSGGSPPFEKFDGGAFEINPISISNDSTPTQRSMSPGLMTPTSGGIPVTKQPLASNGFDPNTVISPTAASFAASGGAVSVNRAPSFRTRQRSSLSARRGMKLDGSMLQSNEGNSPSGSVARVPVQTSVPKKPGKSYESLQNSQVPQESGNRGLFRDYGKYVDIETGSLNFAGKACVHAQGIQFSSGEKFHISMDQLEFISELGAGNYGTVQKVLYRPNGVLMAVKEIRLELDESSLRQIIMELDVLHRCEMSDIIAFYGAFFVEGCVYICMEYMDGGSINKIYEGGLPEKYLRHIVRSVVNGLKELKEKFNIIHRDVKPTNILCSTSGEVKLCDFGVSGNLVASFARTNIGCQAYMAPERIKVDRFTGSNPNQPMAYTAESDIWSLGLSIIEMAKGSYPYPTDSYASIFSQLNAIVEDPSPALDPTKFSPEACDFVNQLLSKSPTNRPKYADIVKHPWLANDDCTMEEMGAFVKERLARSGGSSGREQGSSEVEQPTIKPGGHR